MTVEEDKAKRRDTGHGTLDCNVLNPPPSDKILQMPLSCIYMSLNLEKMKFDNFTLGEMGIMVDRLGNE